MEPAEPDEPSLAELPVELVEKILQFLFDGWGVQSDNWETKSSWHWPPFTKLGFHSSRDRLRFLGHLPRVCKLFHALTTGNDRVPPLARVILPSVQHERINEGCEWIRCTQPPISVFLADWVAVEWKVDALLAYRERMPQQLADHVRDSLVKLYEDQEERWQVAGLFRLAICVACLRNPHRKRFGVFSDEELPPLVVDGLSAGGVWLLKQLAALPIVCRLIPGDVGDLDLLKYFRHGQVVPTSVRNDIGIAFAAASHGYLDILQQLDREMTRLHATALLESCFGVNIYQPLTATKARIAVADWLIANTEVRVTRSVFYEIFRREHLYPEERRRWVVSKCDPDTLPDFWNAMVEEAGRIHTSPLRYSNDAHEAERAVQRLKKLEKEFPELPMVTPGKRHYVDNGAVLDFFLARGMTLPKGSCERLKILMQANEREKVQASLKRIHKIKTVSLIRTARKANAPWAIGMISDAGRKILLKDMLRAGLPDAEHYSHWYRGVPVVRPMPTAPAVQTMEMD